MEMKLQIIETPDYILAVSDEDIKEGYGFYFPLGKILPISVIGDFENEHSKNIIAYRPKGNTKELLSVVQYGNMTFKELNGDGSWYECIDCEVQTTRSGELLKSQGVQLYKNKYELDLPLLPEIIVEDDVEMLIDDFIYEYQQEGMLPSIAKNRIYELVKAATKVYSEEDLKTLSIKFLKYFEATAKLAFDSTGENHGLTLSKIFDKFIKIESLKQPKTPKWFVAEMEQYPINYHKDLWHNKLKTTTINDKTYLVGTYLYE